LNSVSAQDAVNVVIGDAGGPIVGDVDVDITPVAPVADIIAVNEPVQPILVNLNNLIQDIDRGIDERWREGREPTLSSCCTSVGSNVEIPDYCTCDHKDDEVTSGIESDSDILILCCGEYRSLGETCVCER